MDFESYDMDENKENPPADMQKTSTYFRTIVAFHNLRDRARETAGSWQDRGLSDRLHDGWNTTRQAVTTKTRNFFSHPEDVQCEHIPEKYNYVFRPKSRWELILLSGTVCGIEFCYAAETAFVTPILLSLGLSIKFVTMIWCLSPLIGLFLTPILGSMSDSWESKFGRRRPFIIMYSIGILLGLILVPNGHHIGLALGDKGLEDSLSSKYPVVMLNGTSEIGNEVKLNHSDSLNREFVKDFNYKDFDDTTKNSMDPQNYKYSTVNKRSSLETQNETLSEQNVPLAIYGTRKDYQNFDAILDEDETENTEMDEFSNPGDEFSKLIEKSVSVSGTKQEGIKSPSGKNKYSRRIDDADIYPSLQFSRMNMKNIDTESENDSYFTQTEKPDILEDEFSQLINKENDNSNELSQGANPSNKHSRRIDDEDISPNLQFGRMNVKYINTESENDSNFKQTERPDILEDEFSHLINKENDNSNELSLETNPSNKYSRKIDDEDISPNLQFGRMNVRNVNTESENDSNFKQTEKPGIHEDKFSQLINKENDNSNEFSRGTNPSYKHFRRIDDEDISHNLQFGRMNVKNVNIESENDSNFKQTENPGIDEHEFSQLINKEIDNSNELSRGINPSNKYSRKIDDEDISPNLQIGRMNIKNVYTESENGKYKQSSKSDILKDEFSEIINKENVSSTESPLESNSSARQIKNTQRSAYSHKIEGDDINPKFSLVQNSKGSFPEIHNKNIAAQERPVLTLSPETKINSESEINTNQKKSKLSTISDLSDPNYLDASDTVTSHIQTWSVVFTVIGTVLLDFCSDACQSPSRTYLLDVSIPSDHAAGLSTFTVMAGFGGAIGYAMGAIHWETTYIGQLLGGQVNVVFMIVTVIFLICLITTVTSFPEIPLSVLKDPKMYKEYKEKFQRDFTPNSGNELQCINTKPKRYGSTDEVRADKVEEATSSSETQNDAKLMENMSINDENAQDKNLCENIPGEVNNTTTAVSKSVEIDVVDELGCANERPTLKEYLKSIIHMPASLRVLCLTNLFCWMSLVCYSLYFTDFVGECVFRGDPQAPKDSENFLLFQNGVQFGCWGMALYSISCSIYSLFIESLVKKVGARSVYIGGQLVYSCGMVVMAITRHKAAVILLSPTAGIMYSTLFTMPYLLIAHYHCNNQFSDGKKGNGNNTRGIGTDVAAVSSMVFLSQFILSLSMGSIVEAIGSNVVPVCAAALLSACGAISATKVTYLDI